MSAEVERGKFIVDRETRKWVQWSGGGGVIDGCSAVIEEMVYTSKNTQTTCPAGQNVPDWMAALQLA